MLEQVFEEEVWVVELSQNFCKKKTQEVENEQKTRNLEIENIICSSLVFIPTFESSKTSLQ
jgi:hypothetical protein